MAVGPVKTAAQANANWAARMADGTTAQKFQQGVNAVTVAPNSIAASPAAIQKYAAATQAAVASGRLANGNNRVDLGSWKQATSAGAQRLASGAAAKKAKQLAAAQRLQAGWQAARDGANAIPKDGSIQSSLARVQAAMVAMKQAAGKPIT